MVDKMSKTKLTHTHIYIYLLKDRHEHMAKRNCHRPISQGGAQHTVVSLFGLGFGMWFAKVANASPVRVWVAYITLTIVHLFSNYIAMRVLALRSINRHRMDVLLDQYFKGGADMMNMLSLAYVARVEKIFSWPKKLTPAIFRGRKWEVYGNNIGCHGLLPYYTSPKYQLQQ